MCSQKTQSVIKMFEKLLFFDDELDKLKETGWGYEILCCDNKKIIYNFPIPLNR
ncbi:MAG: hypothetical protein GTN76_17025 [Candidatus Aenigmarchaeota archaeon]|nr:hypothetical protein [Candidatus Aenigmarchaeota archaeon]